MGSKGWLTASQHKQPPRHRYQWTPTRLAIDSISRIVMALSTLQGKLLLREGNRK